VVLGPEGLATLRDGLPVEVSIGGEVERASPGRRTAWISPGRDAGLLENDSVLVRRGDIPIARGRIALLDDAAALCRLTPVVGNALSEPGDRVELWPAPGWRRRGQLNTVVLDVNSDGETHRVTLIGTQSDGVAEGRLVDLYRAGEYVGVASVTRVGDPLSQAELVEPATRVPPAVGDLALVRLRAVGQTRPLSAAVFRVEDDYCLLAAGETDGVQVGEEFVVRRRRDDRSAADDATGEMEGAVIARLVISTVKIDYSGAHIERASPTSPRVQRWDVAERPGTSTDPWKALGTVERAGFASRTAWVTASAPAPPPGQVVRWKGGDAQGGGVVIHRAASSVLIYVPPGWGDVDHLDGAAVEYSSAMITPLARDVLDTQPALE
jgi:hypothetical protein